MKRGGEPELDSPSLGICDHEARPAAQPAGLPVTSGPDKPHLGISACLLGENVRYDGGHKRDAFLADRLTRFVSWTPICPEVETGLGVPRPPIRLEQRGSKIRLVSIESREDITDAMHCWTCQRLDEIEHQPLAGYVFKARSPSCGLDDAPVEGEGAAGPIGAGMFAAAWRRRFSDLPVIDEDRLRIPAERQQFIERVFAAARVQQLCTQGPRVADLVAFHSKHKYQIRAHSPQAAERLGRLIARSGALSVAELCSAYRQNFMAAMACPSSRGRIFNVLQHIFGHLSERLSPLQRERLLELLRAYRGGGARLWEPAAQLCRLARELGDAYIGDQTFLRPYPGELMREVYQS